jgi:ATP-dependent DNA helicase RecG
MKLLEWYATPLKAAQFPQMGPKSLERLAQAGLRTVWDLLSFLPRDYLDFTRSTTIAQAPLNQTVQLVGRLLAGKASSTSARGIPYFEALIEDGFGSLRLLFFNQPYLGRSLTRDKLIQVTGKITFDRLGKVMINPRWKPSEPGRVDTPRIEPVYRESAGIRSEQFAEWIQASMRRLPDFLPAWPQALPTRLAWERIHRPASSLDLELLGRGEDPAQRQFALEEFLVFCLGLQRLNARALDGMQVLSWPADSLKSFQSALPFTLTGDQGATMARLAETVEAGRRIFALIQGDVGSGKTAVALYMAYALAGIGQQTALLAPTTVLASQHAQTARTLLEPLGLRVGLLSSTLDGPTLRSTLQEAAAGRIDLLVGTHRLIQEDVHLPSLGGVVIDEQHRFGVEQRARMLAKGDRPHYLALSATPIPRSLALTLYADFEVFAIVEKPAGRQQVKTVLKKSANRQQVVAFARKRISQGEGVFWIFPAIEGEDGEKSVLNMHKRFAEGEFRGYRLACIHGRMPAEEVEGNLLAFRDGHCDVLLSTTIVEVGVDIPRASVMVIEGANHFGLSQLHQLRGRVGRNSAAAYCFLLADPDLGEDALARLRSFESTSDGFEIARLDLQQRGFGALLGHQQSGLPDFHFLDLRREDSLAQARALLPTLSEQDRSYLAGIAALLQWG